MLGAALEFSSFLASPIGAALVISSGGFCFVAGRAHQQVQQRLDACQQRLDQATRERQALAQRLVEREPRRRGVGPSGGLEALGEDGRWR